VIHGQARSGGGKRVHFRRRENVIPGDDGLLREMSKSAPSRGDFPGVAVMPLLGEKTVFGPME